MRSGPELTSERRRVLFVEDQEDLSELFRELLTQRGHEVVVASDGESALELLGRESFDVAFIDIGLPGIDGFEVARCIRERLAEASPMLVAMTGFAAPTAPSDTFDRHLLKPVPSSTVVEIVSASRVRSTPLL